MVNVYDTMPTARALEAGLLDLGFQRQAETTCFRNGSIQVQLLDAPRLRIHAASGMHYIAVTSLPQLAQQLAAL